MSLISAFLTAAGAHSTWCNEYTCANPSCADFPDCAKVELGTFCASWCNMFTCESSVCRGCSSCSGGSAAPALSPDASGACSWWCNSYTCGLSPCARCSVCGALAAREVCSPWCNGYTCGLEHCTGCSICDALAKGGVCSSWCNRYTCGMSHCAGCSVCSAPASSPAVPPAVPVCSDEAFAMPPRVWCGAYCPQCHNVAGDTPYDGQYNYTAWLEETGARAV